ncbi:MAG TPA: hypothetical protein VKT78_05140 [Fimbriimonadaceae bacterium]|nr:hypothetical protein [Fimbriimonadaceae bacterium]
MQQVLLPNNVNRFEVVHPIYDAPELKCDPSDLGPMKMSKSVRFSLLALRGYLAVMGLMLGYHMLDLAGAFGTHLK